MPKRRQRITVLSTEAASSRSMFALSSAVAKASDVSAADLAANLKDFLATIDTVFRGAASQNATFVPDEIELHLAVTASGGIQLVGTLNSAISTSIRIVLRRRP